MIRKLLYVKDNNVAKYYFHYSDEKIKFTKRILNSAAQQQFTASWS